MREVMGGADDACALGRPFALLRVAKAGGFGMNDCVQVTGAADTDHRASPHDQRLLRLVQRQVGEDPASEATPVRHAAKWRGLKDGVAVNRPG